MQLKSLLSLFTVITWVGGFASQSTIYVSPMGSNRNSGTKDKPVNTLEYALSLSRSKHVKEIVLRNGEYYDVHAVLTAADSGLIIRNYRNEKPILYGGILIREFRKEGNFVVVDLPSRKPDWDFRMVLVNGTIASRSRLPESGYYSYTNTWNVKSLPAVYGSWEHKPKDNDYRRLSYRPDEVRSWFGELKNAELSLIQQWQESYVTSDTIDSIRNVILLNSRASMVLGSYGKNHYVVWNTKAGMRPGTWYWDKENLKVYYWPKKGEIVRSMVVPSLLAVISMEKRIKDVSLDGLILSMGTSRLINEDFACGNIDASIDARETTNLHLDNISIVNTQGNGIFVTGKDIFISNLKIDHCGGTGVYFQGNNVNITNSRFEHLGVVFNSATGIYGYGKRVNIQNCTIVDAPYSGILLGCDSVEVSHCSIRSYMSVLQDGGGIYSSAHHAVKVHDNYIEGIFNRGFVMGIYFDERSQNCVATNNVVVNSGIPVHCHLSQNILYSNNLFIDKGRQQINYGRSSNIQLNGNVFIADTIVYSGPSVFDKKTDTLTIDPKLRKYANPTGVSSFKDNYLFSQSPGSVKLPRLAKDLITQTHVKYIKPDEMSTVISGLLNNKEVRSHVDFSKIGLTSSKLKEINQLVKHIDN